ncbi:fucose-specific lectin [Serendipita vermifera]|nr:fucose-specific lectin [Serendipita vermifera]
MATVASDKSNVLIRVDHVLYGHIFDMSGRWMRCEVFDRGPWACDPVTVSSDHSTLSMVSVYKDHTIQISHYDGSSWGSFINLGGICKGVPAACYRDKDTIDIFHIGTDLALYHTALRGRSLMVSPWNYTKIQGADSTGQIGKFIYNPTAVNWGENRFSVLAIGLNGHLYEIEWSPGRGWSSLQPLLDDAQWTGSPKALSRGVLSVDVFCIDDNSMLQHIQHNPRQGWHIKHTFPGIWLSEPEVVSRGPISMDIFMCGIDSAPYHAHWNGDEWSEWTNLGGTCMATPKATVRINNGVGLMMRNSEGTLLCKVLNEDGEWWPSVYGWSSAGNKFPRD